MSSLRFRHRLAALAVASVTAVSAALLPASPAAAAGTPLPAHVFAPYFETWTTDSITDLAQQSGARYFTLAFLETTSKTSCTLAWNGDRSQTLPTGRYLSDIASLRAIGGDVVPSFGGWSADQAGTEIGDSCKDVNAIVAAYQSVITTYDVTRLDMDIEGRSLNRPDGIDRRNKAIKLLQDSVANGVRIDFVNPMTFDYYDRVTTDMGAAAINAAQGLFNQLRTLYPAKTAAEIWAMEGNTIMPGIDDYPRRTEVTYPADAQRLLDFARANGISILSMWAIQRDNGGCPGNGGSNDCSGIVQSTWEFTHILAPFTGP